MKGDKQSRKKTSEAEGQQRAGGRQTKVKGDAGKCRETRAAKGRQAKETSKEAWRKGKKRS